MDSNETNRNSMNNRGQNVVLGTILVFGILVLFLGVLQVGLIPDANKEVEFQHSQDVQDQFRRLGGGIEQAGATGQRQTTTVKLGVQYPPRLFFINPSPVSGTIKTTTNPNSEFSITNAKAQNTQTADYWNANPRVFSTKALQYRINYNEYEDNPTLVHENSVTYAQFENNVLIREDQDFIKGRQISLTALSGDLSESQADAQTVTARPLSATQTTVPITNPNSGSPVTIEVQTSLSENKWKEILASETVSNGGHITSISCPPAGSPSDPCTGPLTITLEEGVTYNLQMTKVGVGSGANDPKAHYITNLQGNGTTVLNTGSTQLVVQVRDRFNNPVSGVTVPFKIKNSEGTFKSGGSTTTVTTDANGRAQVTYIPPNQPGTYAVEAGSSAGAFDLTGSTAQENTKFEIDVVDASDEAGDIGASINPSGPLELDSAFTNGEVQGSSNSIKCYGGGSECVVKFTMRNDASDTYKITKIRYFYYSSATNPGARVAGLPDKIWVTGSPGSGPCKAYDLQGTFKNTPSNINEISSGGTESIVVEFRKGGNNFETVAGESFGVAMKFKNTSTGETFGSTYLISPQLDGTTSEVGSSDAPPDGAC